MSRSAFLLATAVLMCAPWLVGCGMLPPKFSEVWEAQDVSDDMVFNIKRNIFCETVDAIRLVRGKTQVIPDDYGVQLQTVLSVGESSSFSSNLTYNRTFPSGSQSGVSIGQTFNLGISGELSSTATRTDTAYSYWQVGNIAGEGRNKAICAKDWPVDRRGSSFLLNSDLGIKRFLADNIKAANLLHSSRPGQKAPDKVDVYSYDLKFAVVSSAGVSPSFKLVSIAGGGAPIFNLNRTRTHQLVLTFGPTGPDGFQPSEISFGQHLSSQLNSTLSRRTGGF